MSIRNLLAVAGASICAGGAVTRAQSYPAGFSGTDLLNPSASAATSMAVAPDGRIYFSQHSGELRVWDPASGLIAANVYTFPVQYAGERGLIGIALDPGFASNHYLYAHYSRTNNGAVIKRVTISAANPNTVVAGSEVTLMDLGNYSTGIPEHVGGGMRFSPIDGKLYVGVGENGNNTNSQILTTPWGKLLRLNPDPLNPIPSDNPTSFAGIPGSPTGNNRIIWAVGLRNPFSFAFHPVTGRFFVNEVGENDFEEIDEGVPGKNYGWPDTEGDFTQASFPNYTRPFYAYNHGSGPVVGQCICGGLFYHPAAHSFPPAYTDAYFFGDYVAGWVKRIDPVTKVVTGFATGTDMVVDLATDAQGRLLILCDGAPARLIRLTYTASLAPSILTHPAPQTVALGADAQFTVYAAGNHPLSYQWRLNTVALSDGPGVVGASTSTLKITGAGCDDVGSYDCIVSNAAGNATSNAATLANASVCYPNCDCSTVAPLLNVADFTCFLQKFAASDPMANCDASTAVPALNIADFTCFLQRFAAGCS